ncbi:MAG: DMT family transporter [Cyanobacteriota bacterium]
MQNTINKTESLNKIKTTDGIKFILISSFCFAIINVMVKKLDNIPTYEIAFFRTFISLIMSYYSIKTLSLNPWGNNKKYLILRGLFGTIAFLLFFYTLQKMPLATAITVQYLAPIFTTIISVFFLKEKIKISQWFFFAISFSGIIFLKGFDSRVSIYYLVIGIISAFLSASAYNCIRKLKDYDHPAIIVFYFPLVSIPIIGPYTILNWVQPYGIQWFYLLATGFLTQIAQIYMTKAFHSDKLSVVSNFSYIGAVFALFFGYFIFDEKISLLSGFGIILVILGAILSSIYKN